MPARGSNCGHSELDEIFICKDKTEGREQKSTRHIHVFSTIFLERRSSDEITSNDCTENGGVLYCPYNRPWMCDDNECGPKDKTQCCSTVPDCRDFGGLIAECPLLDESFLEFEEFMEEELDEAGNFVPYRHF